VLKLRRKRCVGGERDIIWHVLETGEVHTVLVGKDEGNRSLGITWQDEN
jgi:hypothetical protein